MIGLLRWPFEQIGAWIESLVAPAPQVQFGVAGAVDEQEERELNDLIASFGFPAECSVPVAGVAAGTGPGQVCGVPLASPCPGQPQEPEHVAELVRYHHVTANQMDGVYCHCGHVSHNDRRHAHHVAGLVEDMIAADVRLANRFRK